MKTTRRKRRARYGRGSLRIPKGCRHYHIRYYDANGQRQSVNLGVTTLAEANLKAERLLPSLRNRGADEKDVTLQKLIDLAAEDKYARSITRARARGLPIPDDPEELKAIRYIRSLAKPLLRHLGANTRAVDITKLALHTYRSSRLREGVSDSTVNRELSVLGCGYNRAIETELLTEKPAIPRRPEPPPRQGFLEDDKMTALIKSLMPQLQAPIEMAILTGWRTRSELLTRQWKHVDLERGTMWLEVNEAKNTEPRLIALTSQMRAILERQRAKADALRESTGIDTPWVFFREVPRNGKPVGSKIGSYYRSWQRAVAAIGRPGLLVHDLRRTGVRHLVRAGLTNQQAKTISGHKTDATFNRYDITDETAQREYAAKREPYIAALPHYASATANTPTATTVISDSDYHEFLAFKAFKAAMAASQQ